MLVIDKPAGLAVHASGRDNLHLGQFLDSLSFGLPNKPELAHRLDRDTSGCLILGRHRQALKRLGALFAHGRIEKRYWAVVAGSLSSESGKIDSPLAKIGGRGNWRMKVDPQGQPSLTEWRLLGSHGGLSWLECRPLTGRTHQIRVHLASIGCPVLGDFIYGRGLAGMVSNPLHLHARWVSIPLNPKAPAVSVTAPVPEHMLVGLANCGWQGEISKQDGE